MIRTFQQGSVVLRRLLSGRDVAERKNPVPITLNTRCPEKWVFVDMEEGIAWEHDGRAFKIRTFQDEQQRQNFVRALSSLSNDTHNG